MQTKLLVGVLCLLTTVACGYDLAFGQEAEPPIPRERRLRDVIRQMNSVDAIEVEHPSFVKPTDGAIIMTTYPPNPALIEARFLELSKKRLQLLKKRGYDAVEDAIEEMQRELRDTEEQIATQKLEEAERILQTITKEHHKTNAANAARRMLQHRHPEPIK